MSTAPTFFWHDYETFGLSPRRDAPAQFAGVRTNLDLEEIEPPLQLYCQPPSDALPDPQSCLLTGITPQHCAEHGVPEPAFARAIHTELARPGTIGLGYNTLRFDDEVSRHLFWRNLLDPYGREWQNGCSRWDLIDLVRCCYALRPEGLSWPSKPDGSPSFKLEDLARANGLLHEAAHDALSDVRATIALAKRIKAAQPRLWEFALRLRSKDEVKQEIHRAQSQGQPFLHVSGMFGPARGFLALVWPLAPHPKHPNELIIWDLSADPRELLNLDAATLRQRLFTKADELPEGLERLPVKTIHLNKSPIVISQLKTLSPERAHHFGLDIHQALRHAEHAPAVAQALQGLWPEVFERPQSPQASSLEVDENLYGGFLGRADRAALDAISALSLTEQATHFSQHAAPSFVDERLPELLWRYRARHFPATLSEQEAKRWQAHRVRRLHGPKPLEHSWLGDYLERIDTLMEATEDERSHNILSALIDHATELAPEIG